MPGEEVVTLEEGAASLAGGSEADSHDNVNKEDKESDVNKEVILDIPTETISEKGLELIKDSTAKSPEKEKGEKKMKPTMRPIMMMILGL